ISVARPQLNPTSPPSQHSTGKLAPVTTGRWVKRLKLTEEDSVAIRPSRQTLCITDGFSEPPSWKDPRACGSSAFPEKSIEAGEPLDTVRTGTLYPPVLEGAAHLQESGRPCGGVAQLVRAEES